MTISAQIIADSVSPEGIRITTFQLRYPRFIHAELMTHRMFSRNASSSRAIPVQKMIEDLRRDPAMPVFWGSNKPGMQAGEELPETEIYKGLTLRPREMAKQVWLDAMDDAISQAEELIALGLHKQIANRILEPWGHINVVVTATDWENFYTLRRHKDAQPEIHALADAMWEAQQDNKPNQLVHGEWHLPYVRMEDDIDYLMSQVSPGEHYVELAKKVSVARCARVSYLTHDGRQTTVEEDLALYERLLGAQPLHASPAEHQATPMTCNGSYEDQSGKTRYVFKSEHLGGNFTGWIQYRKTLPGEFIAG